MTRCIARALLVALVLPAVPAVAQKPTIELPRVSPYASVEQKIGLTTIGVTYHRPRVKGRVVWGALVPHGETWRAGANDATVLTVSGPVKLAGKDVAAGKYALFVVPRKDRWTVILNKDPKQWGAYFTKRENDVLDVDVTPRPAEMTEWLTYAITPAGDDRAVLSLAWERLRVEIPIDVDVKGQMDAIIEAALAKEKPEPWDYFQAAKWRFEAGDSSDVVLAWTDKAVAGTESFWAYELKGRVLKARGRLADAIPLMEEAMKRAKGRAPDAYVQNLEKEIAGWRK